MRVFEPPRAHAIWQMFSNGLSSVVFLYPEPH
nr:MAG TPA: hypothetical protein [Caudoviricetes sp.]